MDKLQLEVPGLEYFQFKNIYTGSKGNFRYRIAPEKDQLQAFVYERFCFEAAPTLAKESFRMDESGMELLKQWLLQQLDSYEQSH